MIDTNEIRNKHTGWGYSFPDSVINALCDEIDRLRKQAAVRECEDQRELAMDAVRQGEKQPPQGKMVNVRVPVAVEKSGYWRAAPRPSIEQLHEYMTDEFVIYWLTADLPLPEEVTVEAEVEDAIR